MTQMSGVAGDGFSVKTPKSMSSGRAVLLLAIAVVLGVVLLHELDNTPTGSSNAVQTAATEQAAQTPANNAAAATSNTTAPPQVRTPSEVKVLVANGTAVNGAANKVAGRLQPIGYQLLKPGNTTAQSATSVVQYAAGYQQEAQALATSLGIASSAVQQMPTPAPIADLQGANVLVIVGNELAGQQATSGAATNGATGTTVPGAAAGSSNNATTGNAQSQTANPLTGPLNPSNATSNTTTPTTTPAR